MGHPLIEEFCRAHELQPHFLRRCQREFREIIQPMLDERDVLLAENTELKAKLEKATKKKTEAAA